MNEIKMSEIIEKIRSLFLNILYMNPQEKIISPNMTILSELKSLLNELFDETTCIEVLYTLNTDKQFFGIHINPMISSNDAMMILTTDDKFKLTKYKIELDSKLFDIGLTPEELTSYLIFEISSMINSYNAVDNVRALIDLHNIDNDDVIDLRRCINNYQFIILGIKDTLYKVSSLLFKEDDNEIVSWDDSLSSTHKKINNSLIVGNGSIREPKTIVLRWMLMFYKNIPNNINVIKDTLKDAINFTGSRLLKEEIEKTIRSIDSMQNHTVLEGKSIINILDKKGCSSVTEASLFKSLKSNGLRSIEDSYYEFAMRIKNCETEEDAMYILRSINTRLNILEDYIYNTPDLSENERRHWEMLSQKYRELRDMLSKKKIWKKSSYGLFINYNDLDYLDRENEY